MALRADILDALIIGRPLADVLRYAAAEACAAHKQDAAVSGSSAKTVSPKKKKAAK